MKHCKSQVISSLENMIVQVEASPFILSSQDLFNGTFEQPTGIPLSIMLKVMV